jgi:2'-5' RNA ligase
VRLFVAVLLPEDVRRALGREIERMRAVARGVSWVAPDNLHVTLKFLGDVGEPVVESLRLALGRVATAAEPFQLGVRGLGAFPTRTRARVVWAGIDTGAAAIGALAGRVEQSLAALGFAPEGRPFAGHVTLGRVREPRRDPALAEALERPAGDFGTVRVDRIALVKSDLSPRGARYTPLDSWPLAG